MMTSCNAAAYSRQPDSIWKYGGAAKIFFRRYRCAVAIGGLGRQAGRRLYLDSDPARWAGVDVVVDDGAPASPRHVPGRTALYGGRIFGHPQRRDALWRQSSLRAHRP